MVILYSVLISLIPVFCAAVLMVLLKYTKFDKLKRIYKNTVITVVFCVVAIIFSLIPLNTESGVAVNLVSVAPVISGLIFGGHIGIIVGVIGGLFRFVAAYWAPALMVTQLSSSITFICAGLLTAFIRKFVINDKRVKWYYALFTAVLVESFHMLMIFATKATNIEEAFNIVNQLVAPMFVSGLLSAGLSAFISSLIAKDKFFTIPKKLKLTSKIQISLIATLLVAYGLVAGFAFLSINENAKSNAREELRTSVTDLKDDFSSKISKYVLTALLGYEDDEGNNGVLGDCNVYINICQEAPDVFSIDDFNENLDTYTWIHEVSEINIVGKDNIIKYSSYAPNIGFNMGDPNNKQAYEFTCLNGDTQVFIQDLAEPSSGKDEKGQVKYAGAKLGENEFGLGYVQIGIYVDTYFAILDSYVQGSATYRRVGENGFLAVIDEMGFILTISDNAPLIPTIDIDSLPKDSTEIYIINDGVENRRYYTTYEEKDTYYIVAFADVDEMMLPSQITILCITFVEIVAFMLLYCIIYIAIKRTVTDRIQNIGIGLQKITDGNLNVKIDERNSSEMDELSTNINKTVESLKDYAEKEIKRNEEELNFAKTIQHSVLPKVFPIDDRFEIYASMDTAKAVGGDFYDFFFLDSDHIVIEIADVSGKGVPAALFMMQSKQIIKNLLENGRNIEEALNEANKFLCSNNAAEMFVTLWIGVVDLNNGHIEYVNAGHNPPIVSGGNNEYVYLKARSGFVLAGYDEFIYKSQGLDLKPGEKIYLYTDGVTEAMNTNQELYGDPKLLKVINDYKSQDVKSLSVTVLNSVREHAGEEEQSDDITMLCFEYKKKD